MANYKLIFEENSAYAINTQSGNNKPLILVELAYLINKKIDIILNRDDLKFSLESILEKIAISNDDLSIGDVEDIINILVSDDDIDTDDSADDLRVKNG